MSLFSILKLKLEDLGIIIDTNDKLEYLMIVGNMLQDGDIEEDDDITNSVERAFTEVLNSELN